MMPASSASSTSTMRTSTAGALFHDLGVFFLQLLELVQQLVQQLVQVLV